MDAKQIVVPKTKIERINDFYNWWQNKVHGDYIKDTQFDNIVQNMQT